MAIGQLVSDPTWRGTTLTRCVEQHSIASCGSRAHSGAFESSLMAKTRPDIDRKEKRDEILGVARRLFVEAGYDVTSMSRIAEESGVAPNTIYWYFADKDALLIAVLNAVIAEGMREYQARKKGS